MADATPKKSGWGKQMIDRAQWGVNNSGGNLMGAMMGVMGMPWSQRRGGSWWTIDPGMQAVYPRGMVWPSNMSGNGSGDPSTGGEDPPYDPNDPNSPLPGDKFGKNLIPEWWKQWYRTQGQYGGVPPVDGLL